MRYNNCYTLKDKEGEVTIKRVFLFKPLFFVGDSKTRFLEFANVVYRVTKVHVCNAAYPWCWKKVPVRFATESDLSSIVKEKSLLNSIDAPSILMALEILSIPIALVAGLLPALSWLFLILIIHYILPDEFEV